MSNEKEELVRMTVHEAAERVDIVQQLIEKADFLEGKGIPAGIERVAAAALSRSGPSEVWEVSNRVSSVIFAAESDADSYIASQSVTLGLEKHPRAVIRMAGKP